MSERARDALLVGKPDQNDRHEIGGGYFWSPKRNTNGARNSFYESMREVAPGGIVFSFADTFIPAVGITLWVPRSRSGDYTAS